MLNADPGSAPQTLPDPPPHRLLPGGVGGDRSGSFRNTESSGGVGGDTGAPD